MKVHNRQLVPQLTVEFRRDEIDGLARGCGFAQPEVAKWLYPVFTDWQRRINGDPPRDVLVVTLTREMAEICLESAKVAGENGLVIGLTEIIESDF